MYSFAINPIKLDRAIKLANTTDEDVVFEKYVMLGGKVADGYKKQTHAKPTHKPSSEVVEEEPIEQEKQEQGAESIIRKFTRRATSGGDTA